MSRGPVMYISTQQLLDRYNAGERNFAGITMLHSSRAKENISLLCGVDLSNIILSGAYLDLIRLRGANLRGAKLVGAYMHQAALPDADLSDADLTGAVLRDVCLNRANLTRAKLMGAQLIRTELLGADLTDADLSDSILCQVGFSRVKIAESDQSQGIYCPNAVLWQMRMADGTYIEAPQTAEDTRKSF